MELPSHCSAFLYTDNLIPADFEELRLTTTYQRANSALKRGFGFFKEYIPKRKFDEIIGCFQNVELDAMAREFGVNVSFNGQNQEPREVVLRPPTIQWSQLSSASAASAPMSMISSGPGGNEPDRGPPAAELQEPDWSNKDSVAQFLGFNNLESIDTISTLNNRVTRLISNTTDNKEKVNIATAKSKIMRWLNFDESDDDSDAEGGGKRRTMKVKKQFRKTKRRIYKKGKKTRVRRNNKSKRVFKVKKDKR
jgi:hypothetical protein